MILSQSILDAIQAEAIRAHTKHGDNSLINPNMPTILKLAALMEEVGEVARTLTYDNLPQLDSTKAYWKEHIIEELIQVASVAASWVESLKGQGLL